MYSDAWRRLGGVTQVMTPFEDRAVLHNRLTHSEKVAQVARSIAENLLGNKANHETIAELGGIDADVVEAAALAHDLGHPPFGHVGEETLDDVAQEELGLVDGFEGNAQTMRILLLTENRHPEYDGLDLTLATIAATAKYPWIRPGAAADERGVESTNDPQREKVAARNGQATRSTQARQHDLRRRKFSAYMTEQAVLAFARAGVNPALDETQTLEASIMDIADDITYAVHDFEDFYLAGVVDVRAVLNDVAPPTDDRGSYPQDGLLEGTATKLRSDFPEYFDADTFDQAATVVHSMLLRGVSLGFEGSPDHIARMRKTASDLIGRYTAKIELHVVSPWEGGPHLLIAPLEWHEVQILKEITRHFVIRRPDFALLQRGQQYVLRRLIGLLRDWMQSEQKEVNRLPPRLRAEIRIAESQEASGFFAPPEVRYRKAGGGTERPYAPRGSTNRCLIDFVCSLTDGQCIALYEKLSGRQFSSFSDQFM